MKIALQVNKIKELLIIFRFLIINKIRDSKIPFFPKSEEVLEIENNNSKIDTVIPKIIWIYWEQSVLPFAEQRMVDRIKYQNKDYTIYVLNKSNINLYLPDFNCEAEMPIANKTDLIRLELLYKYGGIWLDLTLICDENMDWIYPVNEDNNYDLIGYYREKSTIDMNYPIIESWCLACPPKNEFIKNWLDELMPLKTLGNVKYFEYLKNKADYEIIKQRIEAPEYLLVYLACQIAMRKTAAVNLYLKKCEDSAFLLQEHFHWNASAMQFTLCRKNKNQKFIPIIKLTSSDRFLLAALHRYNLIKRNSIMGQVLYNKEY
jgi:hypothetical protein